MGEGRAAASAGGARGVVQGGAMSVVVEWRVQPFELAANEYLDVRRGAWGIYERAGAGRYNVASMSVQGGRDCVGVLAGGATGRGGGAGGGRRSRGGRRAW